MVQRMLNWPSRARPDTRLPPSRARSKTISLAKAATRRLRNLLPDDDDMQLDTAWQGQGGISLSPSTEASVNVSRTGELMEMPN